MYDNNLFFRTSGAGSMTSTETSSAITINETPIDGLCLCVSVPKKSIGDTLQVTLRESTDDSTYTDLAFLDTVASVTAASTSPFVLRKRFSSRAKYLKTVTTVAGTSPDFGAVAIYIGNDDYKNVFTTTPATTVNGAFS